MTPPFDNPRAARARRIDDICDRFEADLKVGPAAVEAYLDDVPAEDREHLRRELDQLLQHYLQERTTSPQDSAPQDSDPEQAETGTYSPDAPTKRPSPSLIPGYEILDEVGRGGMGIVYRARDEGLDRDVAVKLLADRFPIGSPAARRFLEEARITGQLQHPGIPAVHQVGETPAGRPFLAMKLIKGRTLDAILKDRADPDQDRGRLLGNFEQVCQTVGYAHANGVVHRDLKPANVMVGAFGEVQVMDWGLAKVLTDSPPDSSACGTETTLDGVVRSGRGTNEATQQGSLLGTPAYMPPEQAIGAIDQIDARSDVFGLGGILCAILTGKPPYIGDSAESTRQLAASGKLDDAYARLDRSAAEPELVSLCKRCLSADRGDRPADGGAVAGSVAALRAAAEDRARRAEVDAAAAAVRAVEVAKRRRVRVALGAAVGLLAVGVAAFGWWQDHMASERRIEQAQVRADERERAGRNEQAIESLLAECEAALTANATDAARKALAEADLRARDGVSGVLKERLEQRRHEVAVLRELDRIDDLWWTWGGGRYRDADAVNAWATLFRGYGLDPGQTNAEAVARRVNESRIADRLLAALDMWRSWADQKSTDKNRDRQRAEGVFDDLLAVLQAADPDPFRITVRTAMHNRDGALLELALRDEATAQPPRFAVVVTRYDDIPRDRRIQILNSAYVADPSDVRVLNALVGMYRGDQPAQANKRAEWTRATVAVRPMNASFWSNLSKVEHDRRDFDAAARCAREAIRLDPKLEVAHNNLGMALFGMKDYHGAQAAFEDAVRLAPSYALAHNNLGGAYMYDKKFDQAILSMREAVRLDPAAAGHRVSLGQALRGAGNTAEALDTLEAVVKSHPEFAPGHGSLGEILAAKGETARAIACYESVIRLDGSNPHAHFALGNLVHPTNPARAIECYQRAVRADPRYAQAHTNLGNVRYERGELDLALASYREALVHDEQLLPALVGVGNVLSKKLDSKGAIAAFERALTRDPKSAATHYNLGNELVRAKRFDAAVASYKTAIRLAPTSPQFAIGLGEAYQAKGDLTNAIATYKQVVSAHPRLLIGHLKLGICYGMSGDHDSAESVLEKAVQLDEKSASAHHNLAFARQHKGDTDGAIAGYRKATELNPKFPLPWVNLGLILRDRGDWDAAIDCFQKGVAADPTYPLARTQLEETLRMRVERRKEAPPPKPTVEKK